MKKIRNEELIGFCKMVGANLRYLRTKKRLTQAKVGAALTVKFQQVQKYETGLNGPSAWRLKQLADLFEVSPLDILDPGYIAKSCNKKEPSVSELLQEGMKRQIEKENDGLNSQNTTCFKDGA
tara:strand:- start:38 stop:406 length:369 start_codon:yes stop_codon:yes gene_type:complete